MANTGWKRWSLLASGALTAAVALSGCGSSTPATSSAQQVLHFSFSSNIETLDPTEWTDVSSMYPMQEIYDTLVEYNQTNSGLHPGLATWTASSDGKTYTFTLKKGIKFSNGDPVTAQDVIYSLNRVTRGDANSSGAAPYGFAYSDIVGYNAWFNKGNPPPAGMSGMSGLTSPAPGVVQIQLTTPQAFFLNELALMSAAIVDPKVVQEYGQNYQLHAVGTGPYMLKSWNQGHQMILVANPHSWRGSPKVQKVIIDENVNPDLALLRYQQGTYDFLWGPLPSEVYAKIISSPTLKKQYSNVPENGVVYLAFNTTKAPFNNVYMRQAVNYAINKQLLIKDITNGRAVMQTQPLPPGIPGYDSSITNPYPYNQALAKSLLQKAGYNGQPITFIYPSNTTDHIRTAEMIQTDLKAIGLNVSIQGTSQIGNYWPTEANPKGNWNIAWTDWFQDYPDAQDFLENLLGNEANNATNVGNYYDKTFQTLIDTADALPASQQAQRVTLFKQAEQIAVKQAAWAFLYTEWNDALIQPWVQPQGTHSDLMLYLHPVKTPQFEYMTVKSH
ncbi:MAG: ABC transporter substrate-binding protein [Thermaerobacter sp.]|nr:ABC transporter substrate-binding protein [Thermaerobacter sp.]